MPRDVFRLAFRAGMSADDSDTGELMLYGEIVQDYSKWYKEQYPNDKSASDFDKTIKDLKNKGAKRLKLRINSPGGIVNEAVAMRGALTGAGFESIDIRIEGMCASAATLIASIPDAHVVITPGSEYMIHNPWTWAWGNANDMEKTVEHLRQLEGTSRGFYAQKSGQADEQIKRWMDDETWFTAEDAVKYGFADELADEGIGGELPAAACVTSLEMATMKDLYKAVPEQISVREDGGKLNTKAVFLEGETGKEYVLPPQYAQKVRDLIKQTVSNDASVAGASTEINHEEDNAPMKPEDIKALTQEELLAENPALIQQIQQAALAADQQRREDIDAITPPVAEYQAMAEEAKKNGTSAMDFHKQIVAAMKQKGVNHQAARQQETAPAQNVTGGAAEDEKDEEQEIMQNAKKVAEYAKQYRGNTDGGMY